MSDHKFKIGQSLHFTPHRSTGVARPGRCKVMRLVSGEGVDPQYHIKCENESYDRVAWESELR
jgi:hypothetical protein